MTTTKRIISIVVTFALFISVLSAFSISASAATGSSKKYGSFQSKTITITTDKSGSPYMTFKSTGDANYQGRGAKAPIMSLKVYNHSTRSTKYYRITGWGNSVTSKLKLNKNTTYTVTVGYIYDKSINWGTYGIGMYRTTGWYNGLWQITATNKLTYSIK